MYRNILVAIEHSVFALPFAYLSAIIAGATWLDMVLITIAMVGARTFAMAANRIIAIQSDTVARRSPLPCTAPASVIARACSARASVSVDLPASGWLMTAKVRRGRESGTA